MLQLPYPSRASTLPVTAVIHEFWVTAAVSPWGGRRGRMADCVVSRTAKKLFASPQRAPTWFEAERATSIAIVVSAARRPDYHDMTLTLAIALGDVPESQRHWLKDFQ